MKLIIINLSQKSSKNRLNKELGSCLLRINNFCFIGDLPERSIEALKNRMIRGNYRFVIILDKSESLYGYEIIEYL